MGRRFSLAALAALGLPALLLSGWLIYSRSAFGTWDPTAQPDRISYCGRTYLPGEHVSRAIIDSTGNGPGVFSFRQVGSTAGRTPFFAKPLPDSVRYRYGTPPLPYAMAVYLKVGDDDYVAYGLSGGP